MENTNANGKYECKIGGSSHVIWGQPVGSLALFINRGGIFAKFQTEIDIHQIQTGNTNTNKNRKYTLKRFFRGW